MKVTVRYFASIREALGQSSEVCDTQAATVGDLRAELVARDPSYASALGSARPLRMALDQVMVEETTALHEGAEVAFFPPVTGG